LTNDIRRAGVRTHDNAKKKLGTYGWDVRNQQLSGDVSQRRWSDCRTPRLGYTGVHSSDKSLKIRVSAHGARDADDFNWFHQAPAGLATKVCVAGATDNWF
jgi:hypothetical protein